MSPPSIVLFKSLCVNISIQPFTQFYINVTVSPSINIQFHAGTQGPHPWCGVGGWVGVKGLGAGVLNFKTLYCWVQVVFRITLISLHRSFYRNEWLRGDIEDTGDHNSWSNRQDRRTGRCQSFLTIRDRCPRLSSQNSSVETKVENDSWLECPPPVTDFFKI